MKHRKFKNIRKFERNKVQLEFEDCNGKDYFLTVTIEPDNKLGLWLDDGGDGFGHSRTIRIKPNNKPAEKTGNWFKNLGTTLKDKPVETGTFDHLSETIRGVK